MVIDTESDTWCRSFVVIMEIMMVILAPLVDKHISHPFYGFLCSNARTACYNVVYLYECVPVTVYNYSEIGLFVSDHTFF